mmetsp:Transcript_18307/g.28264  ORF Transcript_18307/g.28264 Transcript_18307/m.28264 type:complete len:191 (-) Transcript_18307:63-635(-)|eukprot:CAMPEP_0195290422 /NCGR_PEP_ID=MMETSP0707-20130614/6297_1 /TAXON_ID=33640 /ORGANISM="Asterionellopsis glacialis, Strain CCMP134" /LENGTH=190 /DNA_ID=CAMNT_0040350551 /DNA_START=564 /DNA_END=1136 /DNA_ORIENTATION=+
MIAKKLVLLLGVLTVPSTLAFLSATSTPHIRSTGTAIVPSTVLSSSTYHGPQGQQEWIQKSIEYYTKVMRMEDPATSQLSGTGEQSGVPTRLYHAIQQVRSGNLSRAENLTIRDIKKLAAEEEGECRNAELATTTLLLALVHQKMDNYGEARLVFQRFFRQAISMAENDTVTAVMTSKTASDLLNNYPPL